MTAPAPACLIPDVKRPAPRLLIEIDLEGSPHFVVEAATAEDAERLHTWLDHARHRICDVVVQTLGDDA